MTWKIASKHKLYTTGSLSNDDSDGNENGIFRDQDVPRSQERQYSNNYEWFLTRKKNIGSDFFE